MAVRIWHIEGILTCHQRATVRWHLGHGLRLWNHGVDTTRPPDRRGVSMLFPKRWPLPLACRHRWEYRFGTSKATRRVRYRSHMHFSAQQHGHIGTSPQEQPGGDAPTSVRAQALRLKPRPRPAILIANCINAHAGYQLALAPASCVVRLSGLFYPALHYRRTPSPRPPAWHSHSRSHSHSPYAYAHTYTYICA